MKYHVRTTAMVLLLPVTIYTSSVYGRPPDWNSDTAKLAKLIATIENAQQDDSAIGQYKMALRQSEDLDYKAATIRILNMMGQRYFNKGDDKAMIRFQKQAISIAYSTADLYPHLSSLYNNLGICYQSAGNYDSSLAWYYKALATQQKYGSTISRAIPFINLGVLFNRLGKIGQADNSYRNALIVATGEKNDKLIATSYLNIGSMYAGMNKTDSLVSAASYLQLAMEMAREKGYPDVAHKSAYALAIMAENKGLLDQAVAYCQIALATPMGSSYDDQIPKINLGHVYLRQGKFRLAEHVLGSGLRDALTQNPSPDYLGDFYRYLGECYLLQGKYSKAAEFQKRYIDLSEQLRGRNANQSINRLQELYEHEQRSSELLKKELVISSQKLVIKRNQMIGYISILAIAVVSLLIWYLLRSRKRRLRKQQEKALWHASISGEERERARIARDLHDNIAGSLSNTRQWFATLHKGGQIDTSGKEFGEALSHLDHTISEVRATAHALMPELLLQYGLAEGLKIHCQNVERATGIMIRFCYMGFIGKMDKNIELILYRSIQELLQNAVKHAHSKTILVQISCHEHLLMATVEDKGWGMEGKENQQYRGIGLQHVKRSITELNGTFNIHSVRDEGTSITFEIDLNTIHEL